MLPSSCSTSLPIGRIEQFPLLCSAQKLAPTQCVADILDKDRAINIDKRTEEYTQKGFMAPPAMPMAATTTPALNTAGEQVPNVVEETPVLGKRQVQSGRVRMFSRVTERPMEESITLCEEHVPLSTWT